MPFAATLVAGTIPLAGFVMAGRDERWSDLFVVAYISATGLLLSAAAMIDDSYNLTTLFGLATDALATF